VKKNSVNTNALTNATDTAAIDALQKGDRSAPAVKVVNCN
jgi:hypothetical protein